MTDFEIEQHSRINLKAMLARREIKTMAIQANVDIAKLVSRHIRSMAQSRRFWNERQARGTKP